MKGSKLLSAIFAAALLLMVSEVHSAELMVGATSWYAAWDRELKSPSSTDPTEKVNADYSKFYGPIVSLGFYEKWNISGNFIYGKMSYESTEGDSGRNEDRDTRLDSDICLSYKVLPWLKVFAGGKYYRSKTVEDNYEYTSGSLTGTGYDKGKMTYYAPGGGVGITLPLVIIDGLYFSANMSYVIMRGKQEETETDYNLSGQVIRVKENEWDLNGWSVNPTTSLSYYIAPISTTIILGYRYQYLKYNLETSKGDLKVVDKFYGVTLSALYCFNI